jgi:dipeptidyl aminopeptidase/acylaminoacyl peptidase
VQRDDTWRERFRAATVGFPSWAPSRAERLFFLSDEGGSNQVWSEDPARGRIALTDQELGVEAFVVLPDGSGVAWWCDETGSEYGSWVVTAADGGAHEPLLVGQPAGWGAGLSLAPGTVAVGVAHDDGYQVLVSVGGEPPRVVHSSADPAGIGREWETTAGGLSSDGRLLCIRHSEGGDILHARLRVLDVADGAALGDLADPGLTLKVAAWSPVAGDQRLAVVHERDGVERPAVWDLTTGARRDYHLDLPGPVDVAGWWPDGSALLLVHRSRARDMLHRLDLATGVVAEVHDPQGSITGAGVRPDGEVWLREESAVRAPRIRTTAGRVVLASPRPPAPGRPHEVLEFDGPAGRTELLLCRPDGDPPYPTVLMVHGGPEWAYPDELDPWAQAVVEHGYAVAKVNYRGSTGREVGWRTALHDANIGLPETADVVAGLDFLVAAGIADPTRAAVEGWSWGGYVAVLAAGLYPDRFAAVIGGVPVCDLVLCHEDCSPPQQAYDLAIMGGGPEELPEQYARRSPITYVDAVTAPVLLIAGEHDSACPIRQVRHYEEALRARGGAVETYVYPAGHHANAVEEQLRQAELELEFLARHLGSAR